MTSTQITLRKPYGNHVEHLNILIEFDQILLSFIIVTLCLIIGWEYTVDASVASYVAVEKTYHMSRRRRWVRSRNLVKSTEKEEKVSLQPPACMFILRSNTLTCFPRTSIWNNFKGRPISFHLNGHTLIIYVLFPYVQEKTKTRRKWLHIGFYRQSKKVWTNFSCTL